MAVFSYTSQSQSVGSALISDYADELISAYSDSEIGELTGSFPTKSFVDVNSQNIEEEVTYSYNESSAVYVIDEDFGSITDSPTIDVDYGSILDNDIVGSRSIDYGLITINETLVPYGTINIGEDSVGVLKLIKVNVGKVTLTVLGEAKIFTTPIEFGSGTFSIKGTAEPIVINLSHFGSGRLSVLSGSAEVVGVKYPESTVLHRFAGTAEESTTASYIGSGTLFTFDSATKVVSSAQESQGLFKVDGSAFIIVGLSHIGSGSLFGFSSATEAVGSNPPESTALFKISGAADEIFFKNNQFVGSALLILAGESEDVIAKVQEGEVLIQTSGFATESITPAPHVGSGRLFGFTGSAESITQDPVDETVLLRFSGTAEDKFVKSEVVSGVINLEGSATTLFSLGHIGSVLLDVEGTLQESISPAPHIGSGRLFGFTGSSESIIIDPEDKTTLFTFAGSAAENATIPYNGYVNIDIDGSAAPKFNLLHVGSGSLLALSSATEIVVVSKPESTAIFRIIGKAGESIAPAPFIGTGSLFTFTSSTESTTSVKKTTGLFKVSGSAFEKNTESYIGFGSLFGFSSATESRSNTEISKVLFNISGSSENSKSSSYVGSGTLFGFSSTTESSTSVERAKGLFKFTGSATEKNTESYSGSGALFGFSSTTESSTSVERARGLFKFTGSAVEKNTESYVGSGALFGFSSTTESSTSVERAKGLFKFAGSATESTVPAPHVGSGSIFTFISATETRTVSEVSRGTFKFAGSAVEKNTESYVGSGALFGFSSTTEAVVVNPPESTALFRISGSASELTVPAPHIGSGTIFTFLSATETIAVSPDDTKVLFTFVGEATNKKTDSYRGTGSLFAITGSFEATRVIPQITTILFSIFGDAFEKYEYSTYNGFGTSKIRGLGTTSKIKFEPAKPTRIIVI